MSLACPVWNSENTLYGHRGNYQTEDGRCRRWDLENWSWAKGQTRVCGVKIGLFRQGLNISKLHVLKLSWLTFSLTLWAQKRTCYRKPES